MFGEFLDGTLFWWTFARIKLRCDVGGRFFDGGVGNKFGDRLGFFNLNVGSWVTAAVFDSMPFR